MRHSEYVSGSAYIFKGRKDYVTGCMTLVGLDATFSVAFDTLPAGSSQVEPGLVPASDRTLVYLDIETRAEVGSQFRLDGGMVLEHLLLTLALTCLENLLCKLTRILQYYWTTI